MDEIFLFEDKILEIPNNCKLAINIKMFYKNSKVEEVGNGKIEHNDFNSSLTWNHTTNQLWGNLSNLFLELYVTVIINNRQFDKVGTTITQANSNKSPRIISPAP